MIPRLHAGMSASVQSRIHPAPKSRSAPTSPGVCSDAVMALACAHDDARHSFLQHCISCLCNKQILYCSWMNDRDSRPRAIYIGCESSPPLLAVGGCYYVDTHGRLSHEPVNIWAGKRRDTSESLPRACTRKASTFNFQGSIEAVFDPFQCCLLYEKLSYISTTED